MVKCDMPRDTSGCYLWTNPAYLPQSLVAASLNKILHVNVRDCAHDLPRGELLHVKESHRTVLVELDLTPAPINRLAHLARDMKDQEDLDQADSDVFSTYSRHKIAVSVIHLPPRPSLNAL